MENIELPYSSPSFSLEHLKGSFPNNLSVALMLFKVLTPGITRYVIYIFLKNGSFLDSVVISIFVFVPL